MALVQDSIGDFVLFPRDQSYIEMLDPRLNDSLDTFPYNPAPEMQHQFSDLVDASYDPYPPVSTFVNSDSIFYGTVPFASDESKGSDEPRTRRFTPSGIPSPPSGSHSRDHPSSVVSSTSGASAQSTASSIAGSPYVHAAQNPTGQEHWTGSPHGLGIGPPIVHEGFGHEVYPLDHIGNNSVFGDDKFPGSFVGESDKISSSCISTSFSMPSSVSSCSASQAFIPAFSAPPLVLDTSVATRDVTIDTILSEINGKMDTPAHLISPASTSSVKASPNQPQRAFPANSPLGPTSVFKSPTTPASARSPLASCTTSPLIARHHDVSQNPGVAGGESQIPQSPSPYSRRFHPYRRPAPSLKSQSQLFRPQSLSSFFDQSSGRFIAPLESSCWFSLTVPYVSTSYSIYSRSNGIHVTAIRGYRHLG